MSRLFIPSLPIEAVAANRISPQRFTWGNISHPVNRIEEYWLADFGWWRSEDYVARDYFLLTTKTGLLVEIYRSLVTDLWFLQRLHD
jgi:hypothetical protein